MAPEDLVDCCFVFFCINDTLIVFQLFFYFLFFVEWEKAAKDQ